MSSTPTRPDVLSEARKWELADFFSRDMLNAVADGLTIRTLRAYVDVLLVLMDAPTVPSTSAGQGLGLRLGLGQGHAPAESPPCSGLARRLSVAETIQSTLRHLEEGHRGGRVVISAIVQLILHCCGTPGRALTRCEVLIRSIGCKQFVVKPSRRQRKKDTDVSSSKHPSSSSSSSLSFLPDLDAAMMARAALNQRDTSVQMHVSLSQPTRQLQQIDVGAAINMSTGTGQPGEEEGGKGEEEEEEEEEEVDMSSKPIAVHSTVSSSSSSSSGGGGSSSGDGSSGGVVTQKASEAVLSEVLTSVDRSLSELLRATTGR